MQNSKILNFSSYLLLTLAFLILPQAVFALGQMSEPIVVENAMRGEKIQKEMIVVNSDSFAVPVELTTNGNIGDWTEFYLPNNLKETITSTTIPAKESLRLVVIFSLPSDAPSGEYKGAISVTNMPPSEEESDGSQTYVRQKIDREVSITLSDSDEVIDISKTSVIPNTYDVRPGEELKVRVIYDNQGNVSVSPQIRFTVKRNEKSVHDLIYPYSEENGVNSLSQHEIEPITVQTTGWEEGRYQAKLTFLQGDKDVWEKDFIFSISPESSETNNKAISFASIDKRLLLAIFVILLIVIGFTLKKFIVKK